MEFQYHPYTVLLIVSSLLSFGVAFIAWRRRGAPGAVMMTVSSLALALWSLCYGLMWLNTDFAAQLFWLNMMYLGAVIVPLSTFILILQVMHKDHWLTRNRILLLCIEPVLTLIAFWTNESHHLYHSTAVEEQIGPYSILHWTHGPLYWVNMVYSYSLLLVCIILLTRALVRAAPLFRSQTSALLVSVCIPWVGSFLSIFQLPLFKNLDTTPIALSLSGILIYHALFRQGMFDLLPTARSLLIEYLGDGLVVLDKRLHILNINPAAKRFLNVEGRAVTGKLASEIFPQWKDLLENIRYSDRELNFELQGRIDPSRHFDLKATPLRNKRTISGYLILFRDISDRWESEQALRLTNQELKTHIKEIERLQRKLREQAIRDPMTGLYNRRFLKETLEKEIARAQRAAQQVVIIMLDADNFKQINDSRGHKAGDRALQSLARLIRSHIRHSDIGCRYGGEEFVIVMPNSTREAAFERAEHIRAEYLNLKILQHNSPKPASISVGIASYPEDGSNGDDVLDAADQAMYEVKAGGGNRTRFHRRAKHDAAHTQRKDSPVSASQAGPAHRSRPTKSR